MKRLKSNATRVSIVCAAAAALLAPAVARAALITGPRAVGAFASDDDGRCHAVLAQTSGGIVDVTYDCRNQTVLSTTTLTTLDQPVAVAGYYSPQDQNRHAVVGTAAGDLFDVRYKPNVPAQPIKLTNIHGYGPIESLAAWTDNHNHQNIAVLTTWLNAQVVGVWQAAPGAVGTMQYLAMYTGNDFIDLAGQYTIWDDSNKIELAVGDPTHLKMISWPSGIVPDQWNIAADFDGTNTPWVTNFPAGPDESVLSIGATSGYFTNVFPLWSSTIIMTYLTAAPMVKLFSANNGGGLVNPGPFAGFGVCSIFTWRCGRPQSVAGPVFTDIAYGPVPLIHMVVGLSNGRVMSLAAQQPYRSVGTPQWSYTLLGNF